MSTQASVHTGILLAVCVFVNCEAKAQSPATLESAVEGERRIFTWRHLEPSELQFSCAVQFDSDESELAEQLMHGEPHQQLAAARELWTGHSRRQATHVLQYLAGPPPGGNEFRKLQREIYASLLPQAILRELKEGDYAWGAWLAFLRPDEELVPFLVAELNAESEFLPETILALGNSGDLRALEPLLKLLQSEDNLTAGYAAKALGYLGNVEAEAKLIESLAQSSGWRQVNACSALSKIGTRNSLPALERLAKEDRNTGALDVKGTAEYAIEQITKR